MFRGSLKSESSPCKSRPAPRQRESARAPPLMITMQQQLMKGLLGIYYDGEEQNTVPEILDARHLNTGHKLYTVSVNEVTECFCSTGVHLPIASKEQGALTTSVASSGKGSY